MSYLAAAERTGEWLLVTAERSPQGWSWPAQPEYPAERGSRARLGHRRPDDVLRGGVPNRTGRCALAVGRARRRPLDGEPSRLLRGGVGEAGGLLTGVGGWVVVLTELAEAAGDERARELAGRVLDTIAAKASVTDTGVHWHGLTEMVWGTAGIGCLMLAQGADYLGPAAVELAVRAGELAAGRGGDGARGDPVVPRAGVRGPAPGQQAPFPELRARCRRNRLLPGPPGAGVR